MKKTPKLITHTALMAQWDYKQNNRIGLDPHELTTGSGLAAFWVCPLGHTWTATINSRNRGNGCPYCAGKRAWPGFNDFESKYPELVKEWHPTKNGNLLPSQVTYGSGIKVWWQCKRNHEYEACPRDRARGSGCPICAAALKTSFPEQAIYYYIKKCFPDALSRYTDIFDDKMELDVYIPSIKVGIEYDGSVYHTKASLLKDNRKYMICQEHGIKLVRVYETSPSAKWLNCDRKIEVPNGQRKYLDSVISQLCFKLGRPTDVNIERDRFEILEYLQYMEATLEEQFPEVSSEWDYEANYPLAPGNFPPFSNVRASWICKYCGRKWTTMICTRTARGDHAGCKYCTSKESRKKQIANKIKNNGSLYDLYPNLMAEWDYEKNTLDPRDVLPGSAAPAFWVCSKCGFKWETAINKRVSGHGCLHCSHQAAMPGVDDLATRYPKLSAEWDHEKNTLDPHTILPGCNKKVFWICSKCGYNWVASVNSRTSRKSGCPCCSGRVAKVGVNDLKTLYPELATEWDYDNNEGKPEHYKAGSDKEVVWQCSNCGHRWVKRIVKRVKFPKCPACQNNILDRRSK